MNWARVGKEWLPLKMLAADYRGPLLLTDETQTVQWFVEDGDLSSQVHENERIEPAFWAMVRTD